jgi:hypothetical protein
VIELEVDEVELEVDEVELETPYWAYSVMFSVGINVVLGGNETPVPFGWVFQTTNEPLEDARPPALPATMSASVPVVGVGIVPDEPEFAL